MILLNGVYLACGKVIDVNKNKTGINTNFFIIKDAKKKISRKGVVETLEDTQRWFIGLCYW